MTSILRAADLFCGAGGTSQGAEQSGAARVVCAVNHWQVAVETHSANFPHARHINSRLDQVNPSECPKIDLLFASPECIHHSRARGGRPTNDQARSGAWDVMRWVEFHRPQWIVIENVPEFRSWGPVGADGRPLVSYQGRFFSAWIEAIRSAGYRVDDRLLNAADYGAATSRTRLFVVARKGNRSIRWPEPSHSRRVGGELPGFRLNRWRSAAEIIDWSIPCQSVFARKHPLKDKTLLRIDAGLRKFVEPFVVELRNNMTARSIDQPISTVTASGAHHGMAVPFTLSSLGGGAPRSIEQPTPTQTANGGVHLAVPFIYQLTHGGRLSSIGGTLPTITTAHRGETGIAIPFIKPNVNKRDGQQHRSHGLSDALPTVTTRGAGDLIMPFIVTYYGNGKAYPVTDPLCTLTTRDRCGLGYAVIQSAVAIAPRTDGERRLYATMQELGVADVGFRMLANAELSLAQGFPSHYLFHGNKGDVTKQIGNSVCPDVAAAITTAIAA